VEKAIIQEFAGLSCCTQTPSAAAMKILLSAIACDPFQGSETVYGWRACRALARDHEVWVLTSEENRAGLERAAREGLVPENMHFLYLGEARPYHENRLFARGQSWARYMTFAAAVLPVAAEAHRRIGFDRAHHLTYTTWRVACPLWRLGIPLIWGPISGTEVFPWRLFPILSPAAKAFELARIMAGLGSRYSPAVRRCAREAAQIIAIHQQARRHLVRLRGREDGVSVFSGFFFPDDHIQRLERSVVGTTADGPLRIFASGNLEGRKGVALALRGLAWAKARGLHATYRVSSPGPELSHLQGLARKLGLQDTVSLGQRMDFAEFIATLQSTDVYLLPSLREGGGLTMMEAMLAGCVPVVAHCGGPGDCVTEDCGVRIPVTTIEEMTARIGQALLDLQARRGELTVLGRAARARVAGLYNEARFREVMNRAYVETSR
jgi:glycosyltransferase involved in cell wall biosynthesis